VQQTHGTDLAFYQPDAEHIAYNRRGFWLASLMELGGLFVFVAFFNLIAGIGANLDGPGLILLGLLMSLVPAVLWMIFFYRLDRLEPEPKTKLLTIFGLSALVTAAIANPLLENFFEIDRWLYNSFGTQLLGGILLVGVVQSAVIYLVVRYGIYDSPEFDERVDGVIYAIAAGLGLSTVINFFYVLNNGGVDLGIGAVRIVVNALAYASFAGVLGYFLGQARFERTPTYYVPVGLALSALLNGVFFLMEDRVTADGLRVNPWNGLILAALFAVVTLGVVFWLVNRANEETLRLAASERTATLATTASTVIAQEEAEIPPVESSTTVAIAPNDAVAPNDAGAPTETDKGAL
jgi:protease PrsW